MSIVTFNIQVTLFLSQHLHIMILSANLHQIYINHDKDTIMKSLECHTDSAKVIW